MKTDLPILGVWVSESENCLLTDKTFVAYIWKYIKTITCAQWQSNRLLCLKARVVDSRWGSQCRSEPQKRDEVTGYIQFLFCGIFVCVWVLVLVSGFQCCFMLYPSCKFAFVVVLGCFCGLGLVYSNKSCTMPPITFQDLPLNIYMVIFGTGIFVFILSLIFCCYFIRWEATESYSKTKVLIHFKSGQSL